MPNYHFLDHTADIRIHATGDTLPELFINSALGMMEFIFGADILTIEDNLTTEEVKINATDLDSLLVDWLSELLYRSTTNYRAYINFEIHELDSLKLIAKAATISAQAKDEIKAVTYHGLKVEQKNGFWEATVTYDL